MITAVGVRAVCSLNIRLNWYIYLLLNALQMKTNKANANTMKSNTNFLPINSYISRELVYLSPPSLITCPRWLPILKSAKRYCCTWWALKRSGKTWIYARTRGEKVIGPDKETRAKCSPAFDTATQQCQCLYVFACVVGYPSFSGLLRKSRFRSKALQKQWWKTTPKKIYENVYEVGKYKNISWKHIAMHSSDETYNLDWPYAHRLAQMNWEFRYL